ncbi:hypothetical protein GH733_017701, partial [Mirounga leonina]
MWFSELCMDQARQNALSPNPRVQAITYHMLAGIGQYSDIAAQVNTPEEIHEQLREIGLEAWERIRPGGEHYGSWTKVIQKTNEPYVEFLSRLKLTLERTVIGEEARQQLLKLLAYENANEDCKRVILPIKDTGDVNTFMKACKDITSENQPQMQNGNRGYCFIEGRVMLMSPQRMDGPVPGSPRDGSGRGPIRTAPYPTRRRMGNPDQDELPLQAMAHLNLGGRRRRRQIFATALPTWGQIKKLSGEGQKILQRTGKACTPEKFIFGYVCLAYCIRCRY